LPFAVPALFSSVIVYVTVSVKDGLTGSGAV